MKKIIIFLLIKSLFLFEGCSLIGYGVGSGIYKEDLLNIEEIESTEKDSWLNITFKDNELIKGQFRSCANDTLFVTFQSTDFQTSTSNYQIDLIPNDMIMYQIPVNQIRELQIRKGDDRWNAMVGGLLIDLLIYVMINSIVKNYENSFGA